MPESNPPLKFYSQAQGRNKFKSNEYRKADAMDWEDSPEQWSLSISREWKSVPEIWNIFPIQEQRTIEGQGVLHWVQ